jgi:hypothetical protein
VEYYSLKSSPHVPEVLKREELKSRRVHERVVVVVWVWGCLGALGSRRERERVVVMVEWGRVGVGVSMGELGVKKSYPELLGLTLSCTYYPEYKHVRFSSTCIFNTLNR